ncbi:MAG: polysaccharide biosynthesis/export family protein [Crocinitomicaceae bacterium]
MSSKLISCALKVTLLVLIGVSCTPTKTIRFKNTIASNDFLAYKAQTNHVPKFQKNDIIELTLISNNEEFSKLFSSALDNGVRNQQTYTSGVSAMKGFLVQQDGTIDVPYIGKIMVNGRTREDVTLEVTNKLKDFIKEPVIQLKILNFKITVLGDVRNPGTFNIPNEKVSFIEAIGIAGDLNITANIEQVKVYRELNDSLTESIIDLSKNDVFFSPYFMLKQNDIIYIPPNKAKSATARYSPIYIPLLTSVSLLLTTLNLFLNQ